MGATVPETNPHQPTDESPLGILIKRVGNQQEQIDCLNAAIQQLAYAIQKSKPVDGSRALNLDTAIDLVTETEAESAA